MISPTAPVPPFKFGEKIDDPVTLMLLDYNTVTANLTGKPAISIPYRVVNGLPIGMQIMANSLKEKSLLYKQLMPWNLKLLCRRFHYDKNWIRNSLSIDKVRK